jgi:hypothetical protein
MAAARTALADLIEGEHVQIDDQEWLPGAGVDRLPGAGGRINSIIFPPSVRQLGEASARVAKKGSTPDAVRMRRNRLMTGLLEAGLLVAGQGDVYRLRS